MEAFRPRRIYCPVPLVGTLPLVRTTPPEYSSIPYSAIPYSALPPSRVVNVAELKLPSKSTSHFRDTGVAVALNTIACIVLRILDSQRSPDQNLAIQSCTP